MSRKITILSLMAGRWHCLEPYIHALTELDWPVKDLKLLWYSNALERFTTCLKWQKMSLEKAGYKIKLVADQSIPPAYRVFHDGDKRSEEHLNAIAALYNAAWQYVDTDDVLLLEDDVIAPSHTLQRLTKVFKKDPTASIVSGCVFDRHHHGVVFSWDILPVPLPSGARVKTAYRLVPVGQPWGVRRVGCTGFSCTLIRRSRLSEATKGQRPFRSSNPKKSHRHIGGADLVFCQQNKSVYTDFDVRAMHIDSQARIH